MEEIVKRIPPHSLEAEQSVIGSILMDPECIANCFGYIESDNFYQPDLKIIYENLVEMYNSSLVIDLVTLTDKLKTKNVFDQIGGFEYLSRLAMNVPTSSHVEQYAKIVKEKSYLRKLIKHSQDIINEAFTGDINNASSKVNSYPSFNNKNRHKQTSEIAQEVINDIARRYMSGTSRGMKTGYIDLDKMTDGIKDAELIGLYAESNAGKSIMACDIAVHTSNNYGDIAFFAFEMRAFDIVYRMLPSRVRVDVNAFNKADKEHITENVIKAIKSYNPDELNNIHIFANDLEHNKPSEVESRISKIPGLKLIIIDYLQLMHPDMKVDNERDRHTQVLRELKKICARYGVPILLLMSQTKEGNFRGTEEIKHDLDQMWKLERKVDGSDQFEKDLAKLKIEKGRNNGKGSIKLVYDEKQLTFRNYTQDNDIQSIVEGI